MKIMADIHIHTVLFGFLLKKQNPDIHVDVQLQTQLTTTFVTLIVSSQ